MERRKAIAIAGTFLAIPAVHALLGRGTHPPLRPIRGAEEIAEIVLSHHEWAMAPRDAIARMIQLVGKLDPACLAALGRVVAQADPAVVEMAADREHSS